MGRHAGWQPTYCIILNLFQDLKTMSYVKSIVSNEPGSSFVRVSEILTCVRMAVFLGRIKFQLGRMNVSVDTRSYYI